MTCLALVLNISLSARRPYAWQRIRSTGAVALGPQDLVRGSQQENLKLLVPPEQLILVEAWIGALFSFIWMNALKQTQSFLLLWSSSELLGMLGSMPQILWISTYANTLSCLTLIRNTGPPRSALSMTGRGFPRSHLLFEPFNQRCWSLNLGPSACRAVPLPLSHSPYPLHPGSPEHMERWFSKGTWQSGKRDYLTSCMWMKGGRLRS